MGDLNAEAVSSLFVKLSQLRHSDQQIHHSGSNSRLVNSSKRTMTLASDSDVSFK